MKLLVKRVYCPSCHKLVRGREQLNNSETQILCSRCGRLLYGWNGIRWKLSARK